MKLKLMNFETGFILFGTFANRFPDYCYNKIQFCLYVVFISPAFVRNGTLNFKVGSILENLFNEQIENIIILVLRVVT